jgi:hypothetical protein
MKIDNYGVLQFFGKYIFEILTLTPFPVVIYEENIRVELRFTYRGFMAIK